jgi:hypothetical protein
MWQRIATLIAGLVVATCGTRPIFRDARVAPTDFGHFIEAAPVVVVALTMEKRKVGRTGSLERPSGLTAFPAQQYICKLRVQSALKGVVSIGATVESLGYEYESPVLIGAPQGMCGNTGRYAVYFLRQNGNQYRSFVDVYQSYIPLTAFTTRAAIEDFDDVASKIWNYLILPYRSGRLNPRDVDFFAAEQYSGFRIGRPRMIEMLERFARDSDHPEFAVMTCLYLSKYHGGFAGDKCLSGLRATGSEVITSELMVRQEEVQASVSHATEKVLLALRTGWPKRFEEVAYWGRPQTTTELRVLLEMLTRHDNAEIRRLARRRLNEYYPVG